MFESTEILDQTPYQDIFDELVKHNIIRTTKTWDDLVKTKAKLLIKVAGPNTKPAYLFNLDQSFYHLLGEDAYNSPQYDWIRNMDDINYNGTTKKINDAAIYDNITDLFDNVFIVPISYAINDPDAESPFDYLNNQHFDIAVISKYQLKEIKRDSLAEFFIKQYQKHSSKKIASKNFMLKRIKALQKDAPNFLDTTEFRNYIQELEDVVNDLTETHIHYFKPDNPTKSQYDCSHIESTISWNS